MSTYLGVYIIYKPEMSLSYFVDTFLSNFVLFNLSSFLKQVIIYFYYIEYKLLAFKSLLIYPSNEHILHSTAIYSQVGFAPGIIHDSHVFNPQSIKITATSSVIFFLFRSNLIKQEIS